MCLWFEFDRIEFGKFSVNMEAMDNMVMLLRIGGEADAALASKANEVQSKLGELTAAKMKVTKLIMEMDKWMKAAKDEVQPAYACMMSAHEYVLIFF